MNLPLRNLEGSVVNRIPAQDTSSRFDTVLHAHSALNDNEMVCVCTIDNHLSGDEDCEFPIDLDKHAEEVVML